MGDAKRKQSQLAAEFISEIRRWGGPEIDGETQLFAEISSLPREDFAKPQDHKLAALGTVPRQCHLNCFKFVSDAPLGADVKAVSGWLVVENSYAISHTLVELDGNLVCITPGQIPPTKFVRDRKIVLVEEAGTLRPTREGGFHMMIRANPALRIERSRVALDLIKGGMSPLAAIEQSRLMELD